MDAESSRARREESRRAARRHRLMAVGALAVLAVALLAIVLVSLGGGRGTPARSVRDSASARTRAGGRPGHHASRTHSLASTVTGTATGRPGTAAVPILMYHVIATPPPGAPFPGLYVPPAEFAEQMQALKAAGWHAVTLDQMAAYWRRGVPLGPGKPIVLSFDNGYQSQYTQALPVLRRLGWVGDENLQLTGLPPSQGGLGQQEIHELVSDGWELDTQGFSHADLITLDSEQLHYQVAVSRQVLQRRFHVPVNWFCYPSGHYDPTVVAAVAAAGYAGSTTVVPGWAHPGDDPYRLHRLRVLGGTDASQLLGLISGAREEPAAPASYSG